MKPTQLPRRWILMGIFGLVFVAWAGKTRAQQPLGIDVSSYQGGSINWSSVKSSGRTFAWAKATEGTYYIDADFTVNEVNAKAAGVYIGGYHFARPDDDPGTAGADAEAAYFWNEAHNYLTGGNGYLIPMLDFETSSGTGASMSTWINEWCQDIKNYGAANGAVINPTVYTDGSIASSLSSPATDWPLDIADPGYTDPQGESPSVGLGPWSDWTFWQYSWTGSVSGVSGQVDEDILDGSATTLQAFLITSSGTSAGAGVALDWDPGAKKASPGSGGAGTWDNGTAKWWLSGTGDVDWSTSGDYATFAETAGTVTLGASVSADGLAFNTAGYVISGSDTLTLNSPGNINVAPGSPTYIECVLAGVGYNLSGGGILVLNNAANASGSGTSAEYIIGPGTTLVVASDHDVGSGGVTLNLQAGGIYQDNDSTSGDQFLLPGSAIALLTGGGIFDNPNANLTMTNYITGPGSLTIIGTTYTLTLTHTANNYTGGTIVQSGALKANAAGTMGSTSGPLTVSGGTLDLGGASHTVGAVTISGGTIQDGTLTGSSYSGSGGTVSAVLAGSGAMTVTSGTFILTGANTFSGGTTVDSGAALLITADSGLGASTASLTLNGGCLKNDDSAPTLNSSRTITLGTSGGYFDAGWAPTNPITINSKLTGSGQLLINMDGSPVVLANTGNNYTGDTIIGTNGPSYYASGTQAWLKLGASGVIPNGSGHGNLTINQAYLGLLDLAGFSQTINGLSGTGTVNNSTGNGSLSVGNNDQTSVFSGLIKNTGGTLALTKVGSGTLTLSGTNTYSGNTTIDSGTLAVGNNSAVGVGAINFEGGAMQSASSTAYTLNNAVILSQDTTFGGTGNLTFTGTVNDGGASKTVTVNSGIIVAFDGIISDGGANAGAANTKAGGGTLVFGGVDTYNKPTVISAGTLALGGSASINNTPTISIAAGATFDVSAIAAYVLSSNTTLNAGGNATPANINGGATINLGSQPIVLTYDGSDPALTISQGTLSLNGNAFTVNGSPLAAGTYVLIQQTSGNITSSGSYSVTGTAIGGGTTGAISVSGGSVLLAITNTTTTTLNALTNSTYGQPVTFTATVAPTPSGGTVQFFDNSVALGGPMTVSGGTASYSTNTLAVGSHPISAAYSGTAGYAASTTTSNSIQQVILPPNSAPVTISGTTILSSGAVQMNFTGIPGYTYLIEATTDLTPPAIWTILSTNVADINGLFNFTDLGATNYPGRYYQTVVQ